MNLSHDKAIWWTVSLAVIGALGTLAAFWDKIGKAVVLKVIWPVIKYLVSFLRIPYEITRLSHEVSNNGGPSLKDLIQKNTEETIEIGAQVKIINRRSRAAMAISPHANFEADLNGNWVWANKALYRLFKATGDEVKGWAWLQYVDDNDRDRVEGRWKTCVLRGEDMDASFTITRQEGNHFDRVLVHSYVHVMKDEHDKVLGYFGMFIREA